MSTDNPNKAAFPIPAEVSRDLGVAPEGGMTKREAFAKAAMQGLLSDSLRIYRLISVEKNGEKNFETVASYAVWYADALLKKLDETCQS